MESAPTIIGSIGWPHVSLIFALIFIFVFRKQIGEFIGKVKSVGKEGVKTEPIQNVQVEEKRKKAVEELMKFGDVTVTEELEGFIRMGLIEKGLEPDNDTSKILIRYLAVTQLALDYEQIYTSIFGGQIRLLRLLNEVAGRGVDYDIVKTYYENEQATHSEILSEWTLEQYLEFPINRTLITIQDNNYHITRKGQDFLIWLVKTNRSEKLWL